MVSEMGHIAGPHLIDFLGAFGGVLGMSLGLYFQLVSRRAVHPMAVTAFFVVGLVMFLATLEPFTPNVEMVLYLRAFAYLLFIGFEVVAGWYVYQHSDVERPVEAVLTAFDRDGDRH